MAFRGSTTRGRFSAGVLLAVTFCSLQAYPVPLLAQAEGGVSLTGRVLTVNDEPVPDAVVTLVGGSHRDISNADGLFIFETVPEGQYVVRVEHLAYGTHEQPVEVGTEALALRITVTYTAIRLDPVVVETRTVEQSGNRARGSRVNVITSEELTRLERTSRHLGGALRQAVSGIRVRETGPASGAFTCVEFRTAGTPRFATGCRSPVVFLDGVRVYEPGAILSSIPLSDIHRVEVVPPSEAGVLYGTESMFGVILIETKVWAETRAESTDVPESLRGRSVYDWTLEPDSHAWKKVYAGAFVGNAAGLLLSLAVARNCIDFEELGNDLFNTSCGGWATAGSRTALLTLPIFGAGAGARTAGGTDFSHGRLLYAAAASAVVMVPAYALVSTSLNSEFTGTRIAGQALLVFGIPAAATLADRLFRKIRGEN